MPASRGRWLTLAGNLRGWTLVLAAAAGFWASASNGQDETPVQAAKPVEKEFLTKDDLKLHATYYPGRESKDTVPVLLVHDYKGKRGDFAPLALQLQAEGHAVLVPDLRGHGQSTEIGSSKTGVKVDRLRPADYQLMVTHDLEACKKFLLQENNAGRVNIEKLCVGGAGMGATLALFWTAQDWSYRPQAFRKLGQDVKAVVLLSPPAKFARGNLTTVLAYENAAFPKQINCLIAYGSQLREASQDAEKLHERMTRDHWKQPSAATPEEIQENQDLFLQAYDTKLQGTALLDPQVNLPVGRHVAAFIRLRLVNKRIPWTDRTGPLN